MKKNIKFKLSTTHIIMLSFLVTIFAGALLLTLPISSADGKVTPFVDALFTATTSTCVTGLVVVPTASAWSVFGQVVILILIQLGGLGVITVMAGLALFLNRRIGLSDRLLLQDAFNLNSMSGLAVFIKKVILGTLTIEGIGALLYMTVFIPQFGAKGIWYSLFNSVSAFCNAGMDIIGETSLYEYVGHPLVNFVTCSLIVLGGIGYIVWWDVVRVFKEAKLRKGPILRRLTLHSKIALCMTAALIVTGGALILAFEYDNPATIGNLSVYDKIQASFFQSVTTRTAGFASIPQENLTNASAILSIMLMFVGGSPIGTAGGVKTVTIAVLAGAAMATVKNKDDVTMFARRIPKEAVSKAVSVVCIFFSVVIASTLLLSLVTDAPALDLVYETVSAAATVGLSRALTPELDILGKLIITATMYLGRIGPISLFIAFSFKNQGQNIIKEPIEEISVG